MKTKMAEDDEIDVLGDDFCLDNFLNKNDNSIYENTPLVSQNSDILNCDYTIHPQWLLDRPSTNPDCWYDTNPVLIDDIQQTSIEESNDNNLGHVSTENSITDESGWTEKEKNLLERGIEIFGKSNVRLSQFIGSRTPAEVKYYLKNFHTDIPTTCNKYNSGIVEEITNNNNDFVSDIIVDNQIPASIEEVIASVNTAQPTIQINKKQQQQQKKSITINDEFIKNTTVSKINKIDERKFKNKANKLAKFKFKTKLKMPIKDYNRVIKQKMVKVINFDKRTELTKVEITTGKGLAVPLCEGEEIVKIRKDDSDSDLEIDIENSDDNKPHNSTNNQKKIDNLIQLKNNTLDNNVDDNNSNKQKTFVDLSQLDDHLVEKLTSLEIPKREVVLNEDFISDLEKIVHSEFFEGRSAKTPLRYLKIRNHIINCWKSNRPTYITKTSIRQGLKNCGDVNCISRIHCYLEQLGVINFGCSQINYTRPLYDVFQNMWSTNREKSNKEVKSPMKNGNEIWCRQRIKRKFLKDGEGGCTLTHDEKGDVINTTIVNETPTKPRSYIKKPSIRLIYSRPFPEGSQKFSVKINLTTLLLMDFHSHTSLTEVMGLVGGIWDTTRKIATITNYQPCRNIASSTIHCDMCPISQSKSAEYIHNNNLNILGWFHSHPTFAPEPSQQDLDTQQNVQNWIGNNHIPCIGIILSPFSGNGALIASPFRCIIVGKKVNFDDQYVPYKFDVDIIADDIDIDGFLKDIKKIYHTDCDGGNRIDFDKAYFQDTSITYLEKYITSVKMNLAKCGIVSKMTCDYLIDGITKICSLKN